MRSIALIDYGSGNLRSAEKALLKANETLGRLCEIHTTAENSVWLFLCRAITSGCWNKMV